MKRLDIYKQSINLSEPEDIFKYFMQSLKPTINTWTYFVNWDKVYNNVRAVEVNLNIMNYLIGKDNIEDEFRYLAAKHPSIIKLLPILVAFRDNKFTLLSNYSETSMEFEPINFKNMSIDDAITFCNKSGFFELLRNKKITNLVDYVLGVEVGLDTNGRKNRSGTAMETVIEYYVNAICKKYNFSYLSQATAPKIQAKWGINFKVDKSRRIIDFAVKTDNQLYLIETNYYSGGGSKLKATAGEYKSMFDYWTNNGYKFIWITDGLGWKTAHLPLRETFEHTDYLLNLQMITDGILHKIISMEL